MGSVILTKQENGYYLMNTLEKKEVVVEEVYRKLENAGFEHVVPFELKTIKGKRMILHNLTDTYSVLTRLQKQIDSRELVLILKGLLDSIRFISEKQIAPTYVDLDLDYMFIRRDGKVLLTVWMIDGLAPKATIFDLFKRLGESAKPKARKDQNFIDGYLDMFDSSFTMTKLDNFVNSSYEMLKKSAMDGSGESKSDIAVRSVVEPPTETPKPKVTPRVEPTPSPVEEEEDSMLMPSGATTFLGVQEGDEMDALEDDGRTTLLVNEPQIKRELVRVKTGDRYVIANSGETVIGKMADISIVGNQAISRKHATFLVFEGTITLEDLNSSNGTKLNGRKLQSQIPEKVIAGDTITFANEEFVYEEE